MSGGRAVGGGGPGKGRAANGRGVLGGRAVDGARAGRAGGAGARAAEMAGAGGGGSAALRALDLLSSRADELAALTGELIRQPSENPPGDERAVVAAARAALAGVDGVQARVVSPAPGRDSLVAAAGPLGTRTLLLGAHVDTVPAGDGWTRDPFGGEVADGAVHGRGASDNKGAAAAMIVAFRTLVELGVTAHRRLVLVANADEELGGGLGMDHVRDVLGEPVDAAIVGEPSGIAAPFETLYVAARGASRFHLRTRGTAGHTSLLREAGLVSAVDELERALAALRERLPQLRREHPIHGRSDLIVVRVEGGSGWGVVPRAAQADVELRVVPGERRQRVEADLRAALDGLDVELSFAPGAMRWVEPSEVAADAPIVRAAARAWETVLGAPPVLGCFPGGTDGRSLSERGIPTIPGLGPGTLLRAHAPDEHVGIDELRVAAQLYVLTALAYLFDDADPPGGPDGSGHA